MIRAACSFLVVILWFVGCASPPSTTYDYRWHILGAVAWRPSFTTSNGETGIILRWAFDGIRRIPDEFNARVTLWQYPLDTVLVTTTQNERGADDETYEVTRQYYTIRGTPQRYEVIVSPAEENTVVLSPGMYFLHISPDYFDDVRMKEVLVKKHQMSIIIVKLKESVKR